MIKKKDILINLSLNNLAITNDPLKKMILSQIVNGKVLQFSGKKETCYFTVLINNKMSLQLQYFTDDFLVFFLKKNSISMQRTLLEF